MQWFFNCLRATYMSLVTKIEGVEYELVFEHFGHGEERTYVVRLEQDGKTLKAWDDDSTYQGVYDAESCLEYQVLAYNYIMESIEDMESEYKGSRGD